MKRLCAKWFQEFTGTPEEKQKLEQIIRNSTVVLSILTNVMKLEKDMSAREKHDDFDSPSWAYHQAYKLGMQEAYHNILIMTNIGDTNV